MMTNSIFLDLDGTLINARKRLYSLFQHLVPQSKMIIDEYWDLKRNKISHEQILEQYYPEHNFKDFEKKWLSLIETPYYLNLDELYPDTVEMLDVLKNNYKLYVLSARQSKENLFDELKRLGIFNYFDDILVTENKFSKEYLLKEKQILLSNNDILVGDTGYDVITGKNLNIKTVAVTHGFLSENVLREYNPDYIIKTINEFSSLLNEGVKK